MPLESGARLGSHQIIGLLGAGGMGEVYRAQDTKLNRQVAIKVLPDLYAGDPERIARFHREAQAVAALNHPAIAGIYELVESPSSLPGQTVVLCLVLELVEGDTLADRLKRGPVAVEEALAIARQIAEALEAAHEKGICHRDLKPANVKLSPGGAVKVLDFGLAKFLQAPAAAGSMTQSPTLTVAGTMAGMILGTAGYMSPEQAKGYEADQRSDLFSFGCILYELLTGRQAFEGETVSEILAAVIKSDVDLSLLPPRLNPRIVELLTRCLEKNPKKRWHAAADVRVELESVMGRGLVIDVPHAPAAPPPPFWRRAVPVALALAAGAAIAGYAAWRLKPDPARLVTRFSVRLPDDQLFTNTGRLLVALSPDGSTLVYVANQRLYQRSMATMQSHPIPGSDLGGGVMNPVFSPDGQSIVFYASVERALKRLAVSGGAAVTICPADLLYGMSWGEQGIVFGQGSKGILRVPPNSSAPEVLVAGDGEHQSASPQILPGGSLLYTRKKAGDSWEKAQIVVQPAGQTTARVLVDGGSDGRYLPTGHLVYALSGVALAVPFDLSRLAVAGGPVPVVEGVRRAGIVPMSPGTAQYAYSNSGALAYIQGPARLSSGDGDLDLALFDRKGGSQPFKLRPGDYQAPRVSPGGRSVAFQTDDEKEAAVWVYDLDGRSAARRLTFGGRNRSPVWSPDGQWIAFQSDREGDAAIFRQRADGSGTAERLSRPETGATHDPQSWSPDGAHLLVSVEKVKEAGKRFTLHALALKDGTMKPLAGIDSVIHVEATFSPDGRWIAYQRRESDLDPTANTSGTFVEPFPGTGAKYLVPQAGGQPYWLKPNEIVLNSGPGRSMSIAVTTTPSVAFGRPVEFTRAGRSEGPPSTTRRNVDAMPDGERIVGVASAAAPETAGSGVEILVVLNWFDEVRQRAPVK